MAICSEAVTSDAYKGFGVSYRGNDEEVRTLLNASCIRRVSEGLAFAYFYYPEELQGGREYPFGIMQKCYGLLSEQELAASGILQLRESPYTNLYGRGVLIGFLDTGDGVILMSAGRWNRTIRKGHRYNRKEQSKAGKRAMLTLEELRECREAPVETADREAAADLTRLRTDPALSAVRRAQEYLSRTGNPYLGKVGDYVVKFQYADTDREFSDCIQEYIEKKAELL